MLKTPKLKWMREVEKCWIKPDRPRLTENKNLNRGHCKCKSKGNIPTPQEASSAILCALLATVDMIDTGVNPVSLH